MLLIPCPHCGPCEETEFRYGGEAHILRPETPSALSDEEWGAYLFHRTNAKGAHRERWVHRDGCRKWFNMIRHTVSHEILAVYETGTQPPDLGDAP